MKQSAQSFLLVLLIEAIYAVASYLKNRLMHMMQQDQYGGDGEPEFA